MKMIVFFLVFQNQPGPGPPSPSHGRKGERRTGHHSPQHHKREKLTAAQQLGIAPHPQVLPLDLMFYDHS